MYFRNAKLKMPLPKNVQELALLSKWYFGKELHLQEFSVNASGGYYNIAEPYNSYHGKGWNFGEGSCDGYDYSARFWNTVFGKLSCGGIAHTSYGSFDFSGHRHYKRLLALQNSLRGKGANYVRPSFVRLAAQPRARREQNDSR